MIRPATKDDTDSIIDIWAESFPEEESFTDYFFNNIYDYRNSLVLTENNTICSTLQRIPYNINNLGKVSYIYGACTLKNYRSKGLMSKLIEYSEKLDNKENMSASILIPQNESLFDYYKRYNFKPAFSLNRKVYSHSGNKDNYSLEFASEKDADKLCKLYNNMFSNSGCIYRNTDFFDEQIKLFNSLGGKVFILTHDTILKGYAFAWNDDDKPYIQELIYTDEKYAVSLCDKILHYYNKESIESFSLCGKCDYKLGSAKFYKDFSGEIKLNLLYN